MSHASTASWALNLLPSSIISALSAIWAWVENLPGAIILTIFIVVFAIIFLCGVVWIGHREQRRYSAIQALNVRYIQVGFDEMETKRCITIDISMRNDSGTKLRIGNLRGHIELRPTASLPQWLASPKFLPATTKDISPWSDFHVILMQRFPEEAGKDAMSAFDQGQKIQLNLSELEISISANGNTKVLPLWYGVTIEKIANRYLTGELVSV